MGTFQELVKTWVKVDQEIVSTFILFLLLIQEWQSSVTGESLCTSTGGEGAVVINGVLDINRCCAE